VRKLFGCLSACVALLVLAAPSFGTDYQVNFFLGQKMLDKEDWEPAEDQSEFGAITTFGGEDWPVHIAADLLGSQEDVTEMGIDATASTTELDFGVRKIWGKNKLHPFLGGGLAVINGEIEALGVSVDDDGTGYWIDGGLFWRLGKRFNIGFEARYSRADITLLGVDGDAGGEHIGLILGFGKARK